MTVPEPQPSPEDVARAWLDEILSRGTPETPSESNTEPESDE